MRTAWWERIELLFILSYIALYATVGLQGFWEAYVSKGLRNLRATLADEGTASWVFVAELAAFPLSLMGMLIYAADIESRLLADAWKAILLFLVVLFPIQRKQRYREFVRESDARLSAEDWPQAGRFYVTVMTLCEIPCLWMNFRAAFPP